MKKITIEELKKVKFEGPRIGWVLENGQELKAFKENGLTGKTYEIENYGTLEYVYGKGFVITDKEGNETLLKDFTENKKYFNEAEEENKKNAEEYEKRNFKEGDKVKVGNMILTIKQMGSVYDDEDYGMMYKSHVLFEEDSALNTCEMDDYIVELKDGSKHKMIKV